MMEESLDLADEVMNEGRERVKDLRTGLGRAGGLSRSLLLAGAEILSSSAMEISVIEEGQPRELQPCVQDDAYWIGREAIINSARHSAGKRMEVEIAYGHKELRIRFRDDGRGMEPGILESGKPGHWGLLGMRERSKKMGAKIAIGTRTGAGTEVELRIPGQVAYRSEPRAAIWNWLGGVFGAR